MVSHQQYSAHGVGRDRSVDQIVRLEDFRKRHPGVEITSPRQNGATAWKAIVDTETGYDEINRFELRDVLDILEARFGTPGTEGTQK